MRPRAILAPVLVALASAAGAQETAGPIEDNSFLVEEAYNQEPRVVQHIATLQLDRDGSDWVSSFTQEWPAPSQRHQLSYTVAYLELDGGAGAGDLLLHYRYQWRGIGDDPVAIAPRLSLLLPAGEPERGRGLGAPGLQVNLPVSAAVAQRFVAHANAGATFVPESEAPDGSQADASAVQLAASMVWLARPRLNLLLETSWASERSPVAGGRAERAESFLVSPGVRFAFDSPSGLQIVPGVAFPIGVGSSDGERAVFFYLSLEHPF